MKLVADENIDQQIVDALRADGHEIVSIGEMNPGIADPDVLRISRDLGAPLLTADKDFGELVYRRRTEHRGILLIRLAGRTPVQKAEAVSQAVRTHGSSLEGRFAVLTPTALRVKRGPTRPS